VVAEARRAGEAAVYCCPMVCWLRPGRSLEESELMLGSVSVLTWLQGEEIEEQVRKGRLWEPDGKTDRQNREA
jgi:hypothetical protein